MGIYLPNMEMPTEGEYNMTLYVCSDGSAYMDVISFPVDKDKFEAVPVPPHGRLIEAEPLIDYCKRFIEAYDYSKLFQDKARRHELLNMVGEIASAPTIIEREDKT